MNRAAARWIGVGLGLAGLALLAACRAQPTAPAPGAVREAQEFTRQALRHAYRAGMGRALPDRFFWARGKDAGDD